MKIKISEKGKNGFWLWLPTRLVLNEISVRLYFFLIKIGICEKQIPINEKNLIKFVRGFYKCRKKFGGKLEIVDIESKNGDLVKIVL